MGDRVSLGWCSLFVLAYCVGTMRAAAQAEEPAIAGEPRTIAGQSPGSGHPHEVSRRGPIEASAPASRRPSRWAWLRNSVGPFRRSSPGAEAGRARWLVGRDVRFAPGQDPDSPGPSEAHVDPGVAQAASEAVPEPGQATAPPTLAPCVPLRVASVPERVGDGVDPGGLPPALDPAHQPGTIAAGDAATAPWLEAASSASEREPYGLCQRFLRGYPTLVKWFPNRLGPPRESDSEAPPARAGETAGEGGYEAPGAPRRAPPSPWDSPPFPSSEYQGYPLIGVPRNPSVDPLMKALLLGPHGDAINASRIEMHGWVTTSGNWSNAHRSNSPTAYWIVPNSYQMDQLVAKFEREVDWVQTEHIDWGFRSVNLYGTDYRWTTAGGWLSQQLLYHNNLYGYDPVELYGEVYIPRIWEGMVVRVGRWVATPDIEVQYAPDNYLATHSLLFTYDTYTQTGAMFSFQINQRNMVQGAIESGTDMAPWYPGAIPTGVFGWRWVSPSNNDAFYTVLNNINDGKFRYFFAEGKKSGHDNFNYIVTTWQHRFNQRVHTKTEAYFMWQFDAVMGGTPSLGPVMSFGGGGGLGKFIPGASLTYGVLNYTMFAVSQLDYFTIRNEWWRDEQGERTGFPTNYSSHTIGLSHKFNDLIMIRPELGFYHSYDVPAFDRGKSKNLLMYGFDLTIRF